MKLYRRKKRKTNPAARELRTEKFRQRVVHPKKLYNRNRLERIELEYEDSAGNQRGVSDTDF